MRNNTCPFPLFVPLICLKMWVEAESQQSNMLVGAGTEASEVACGLVESGEVGGQHAWPNTSNAPLPTIYTAYTQHCWPGRTYHKLPTETLHKASQCLHALGNISTLSTEDILSDHQMSNKYKNQMSTILHAVPDVCARHSPYSSYTIYLKSAQRNCGTLSSVWKGLCDRLRRGVCPWQRPSANVGFE